MSVRERDAAALAAVSALMTVLAGDGKRDKGLMTRRLVAPAPREQHHPVIRWQPAGGVR